MASDLNFFINLLKQDLQTLSELENLLHQERQHLEQNDVKALDALTSQKALLLSTLESHGKARAQWVKDSQLPLPQLLNLLAAKAPPVIKLYRQCETRLKEIQRLNEINGRVIATSHQRIESFMSIIRGQSKQTHLYGQNGGKQALGSKYFLAQA